MDSIQSESNNQATVETSDINTSTTTTATTTTTTTKDPLLMSEENNNNNKNNNNQANQPPPLPPQTTPTTNTTTTTSLSISAVDVSTVESSPSSSSSSPSHHNNNQNNNNNNNSSNNIQKQQLKEEEEGQKQQQKDISSNNSASLICTKHRSFYIMTQLGQSKSNIPLRELLNENDPNSGMGYKEPGPQGFLSYSPLDLYHDIHTGNKPPPLPKLPSSNSNQNINGIISGGGANGNSATTTPRHQSISIADSNALKNKQQQQQQAGQNGASSTTATTTATNVNSASSGTTTTTTTTHKEETGTLKRKSQRLNRLQKNEEDRRKRKEQKRARAKEKPIYVSQLDELPADCLKMIRKSKIPEEKLKEHFEILLPILRFRTGFNLKHSNPTPKSTSSSLSTSQNQPSNPISPEVTNATTTTTTTSTAATTTTNTTNNGDVNSHKRKSSTVSHGATTNNKENNDEFDSDGDGSRLEQSIVPKGTVDLFEKGDVKKLYKSLKQIGSGGFGSVYLAKSVVDKCEIAIKKIAHVTPKAQRTNLNEIGFLHYCNHPNIVKYLRSHLVEDQVWIAMEYMQGGTLTEACSNHSFNESCIAYVARGMLEGLKYLHSHQLVHRDIKSGNIMMTIEGKIKLVDFGLCVDSSQRKLTHMAGSPFWMSPEMIRGDGYSSPSDIWSFGICLLELANGEPPNRKSSLNAMFTTATYGCLGLDRPERWSDGFKNFLTLCLEFNPSNRSTAEQLLTHPWLAISENPETMKKILAQIFIANVMNHLDPI